MSRNSDPRLRGLQAAYPGDELRVGMTVREVMATQILAALVSVPGDADDPRMRPLLASQAVHLADALLLRLSEDQ